MTIIKIYNNSNDGTGGYSDRMFARIPAHREGKLKIKKKYVFIFYFYTHKGSVNKNAAFE